MRLSHDASLRPESPIPLPAYALRPPGNDTGPVKETGPSRPCGLRLSRYRVAISICAGICMGVANAQTTVTTSGAGTAGKMPAFTTSSNIESSGVYVVDGVANVSINAAVASAMSDQATVEANFLNGSSTNTPSAVVDARGSQSTAEHVWGTFDNAVSCSGSSPHVSCSYTSGAPCTPSSTVTCYAIPLTIYGPGAQDQTVDTIWMESNLRIYLPGHAVITSTSTTDPVFGTRPCRSGSGGTCTGGVTSPGNQIVHIDISGGKWVAGGGNLSQQGMVIDCGGNYPAGSGNILDADGSAPVGAGVWYSWFRDMTFIGFMAGSLPPSAPGYIGPSVIQDTCNSSGAANEQYQKWDGIQVFSSDQGAVATASQSGSVMTVTNVSSGVIQVGDVVQALGSWTTETVSSLGTGTGGTGTYNMSTSGTVSSSSVTLAAQAAATKLYIGGLVESSMWRGGNYDCQGGNGGDGLCQGYGVGRYVGSFAGLPGQAGPSGGSASNPDSLTFADTAVQSSGILEQWNGTGRVSDLRTHSECDGVTSCDFALFTLGVSGNVGDVIDAASIASYIGTATASCTATQSSTTLTVSSCASGTIVLGQWLWGTGWAPEQVTQFLTGGGGAGTYTVSASQTVSSGTAATIGSYIFNFAQAGSGLKLVVSNSLWGGGATTPISVIGATSNNNPQNITWLNNQTNSGSATPVAVTSGATASVQAATSILAKRNKQLCVTSTGNAITTLESDLMPGEEVTLTNCSTSGTVVFQSGGNLALLCFNSGGLALQPGSTGQAGQSATFTLNDYTAEQMFTLTRTGAGTCGPQSFNGGTPLAAQVGTGTELMSATGSFTGGNLPYIDPTTGGLKDSGVSASGLGAVLCRTTGPVTNTGSTSATQVYTCTIAANSVDATGTLELFSAGSVCSGAGSPYSGCTGANTGTCTIAAYLGTSNTAKTYQIANQVTGTDKAWSLHSSVQSQNSTSSQLSNAYMISGTATSTAGQSVGTISQTAASFLNIYVTNSVSADVCGLDQIKFAYTP